jgi:hypothetical protein
MPTEDYSNKTRISRIRQDTLSLGRSKAGNSVSSSLATERHLGDVPIKIKNSSGISIVNRAISTPNFSGPPVLLSLTYTGSDYQSPCKNDSARQSMIMTIVATFNRPVISVTDTTVGSFTVNGNVATVVVPRDRCTDSTNLTVTTTFIVDGIYTVTGSLLIPANT